MFMLSYFLLWAIVILLSLILVTILRRSKPKPLALDLDDLGLSYGTTVPNLKLQTVTNKTIELLHPKRSGTVVVVLSTDCGACTNVYSALESYMSKYSDIPVITLIEGNKPDILAKMSHLNIEVPTIQLTPEYIDFLKLAYFLLPILFHLVVKLLLKVAFQLA